MFPEFLFRLKNQTGTILASVLNKLNLGARTNISTSVPQKFLLCRKKSKATTTILNAPAFSNLETTFGLRIPSGNNIVVETIGSFGYATSNLMIQNCLLDPTQSIRFLANDNGTGRINHLVRSGPHGPG
jgi:hypothetical protein